MKRVGLLTTFANVTGGYSLVAVAETQLQMLLDHSYDPVVLVQENFEEPEAPSLWLPVVVDLRKTIPFMHLNNAVAKDFEQRASTVLDALKQDLKDVDVCITHDIMLQEWYKEHNVAVRRYAKARPDLLWLHWVHSCPTPGPPRKFPESCRYTSPPGYVVYPNDSDKGMVCQTYGLNGREWKVKISRTAHSIDPLMVWDYHPMTRDLAQKADLLNGEVVAIYPARLDRGKQPEKIIYLMAGIQEMGYEARLLIVDWQSAGKRFQTYIDQLLLFAEREGLQGKVNFTSRLDDRCSQGVPRRVVLELMQLSNVYIHPSRVETYSLVVHEAALMGCLLVLNYDLPAMRELFGECAIYMDFSSDRVDRDYDPNEKAFWSDEAKRMVSELRNNRALMAKTTARREWTPQAMWKEFEPLLYLTPVGE